jgi:DNA-binding LacI/PurR family transcriptional regulator
LDRSILEYCLANQGRQGEIWIAPRIALRFEEEKRIVARLVDVAKAAGVSRSTASNVFNNPEIVRPKLRERVEAAARELGYAGPDPKGRMLRSSAKFNAIAVLPPAKWSVADSLRNPVFSQFLQGVGEGCDEVGANLAIVADQPGSTGIRNALVDGFIFARVEHLNEIEPARLRRLPFAVVDFDPGPHISSVRVDTRNGAYAAARHLIALGHRRFAIMSFLRGKGPARLHPPGPRSPDAAGMPTDQEKLRGYAEALAEAGLDVDAMPMVQADPWDPAAAALLLDAAPDATAVLSMAVMQAMAVIVEARRRGLSVPGDLSVVGHNDIPEAAGFAPPVTTVDGMSVEKGIAAARMVFAGGAPRHQVLQPRFILRASTAPPRR